MVRDETTARWLESFLGHIGLNDLHACNALRVSSDEYLKRLFQAPPELLQINKPIPGRTYNPNPYLKRRYLTYDVQLVPREIAERVLACRLQIAEELQEDLACLSADNDRLSSQHRRHVLTNEESPGIDLPPASNRGGSPYRHANFDLAKNYTLHLALTSATRRISRANGVWVAEVLGAFSRKLLVPWNGERDVADRVIAHMYQAVPSVNEKGTFFDPVAIVERVLEERLKCAEVWVKVAGEASQEQLDFKKNILEADL